jgi:enhancing lycopene biosynthesis protein 2
MARSPKVAVLLAGCGHLDGAEIREAVLVLLALDQHGATAQCLAPDDWQHHVVDHRTGQPVTGERRNILAESSRIARLGQCLDLAQAKADEFDALLLPGGYGVAKNLCGFAFKGTAADVRPDVLAFIQAFFKAKKPVGAVCIAPALVALSLHGQAHAALTIGNDPGCAAALYQLGARHQDRPSAREIVIDEDLKLVTAAAYMFDDARLSDVWVGIERCVTEVLKRCLGK